MNELTNIKVNGAETVSKHIHVEGTGKPLKVVAPEGSKKPFIVGSEYKVIDTGQRHSTFGWWLTLSVEGEHIQSNEIETFWIRNGGNWIVTEREQ